MILLRYLLALTAAVVIVVGVAGLLMVIVAFWASGSYRRVHMGDGE